MSYTSSFTILFRIHIALSNMVILKNKNYSCYICDFNQEENGEVSKYFYNTKKGITVICPHCRTTLDDNTYE